MCQVHNNTGCVRLITHAWRNRLYVLVATRHQLLRQRVERTSRKVVASLNLHEIARYSGTAEMYT